MIHVLIYYITVNWFTSHDINCDQGGLNYVFQASTLSCHNKSGDINTRDGNTVY